LKIQFCGKQSAPLTRFANIALRNARGPTTSHLSFEILFSFLPAISQRKHRRNRIAVSCSCSCVGTGREGGREKKEERKKIGHVLDRSFTILRFSPNGSPNGFPNFAKLRNTSFSLFPPPSPSPPLPLPISLSLSLSLSPFFLTRHDEIRRTGREHGRRKVKSSARASLCG